MSNRWIRGICAAASVAAVEGCAPDATTDASVDASAIDRDATTGDDARDSAAMDEGAADVRAAEDAATRTDGTAPMDASAMDAARDASATVDAGPSSTRHVARPLGSTPAANGYWEYLPPGYAASGARSPLLVFWHGIGENGSGSASEIMRVLNQGPPRLINRDQWPNDRPFVVLSPQHAGSGCPSANEVRDFFTFAQSRYNVDPSRIYLTALSCGAIGSWNYLGAHVATTPVAAAVLICGDGNGAWMNQACNLGRVALWGFHGDADGTVAPSGTITPMQNLLRDCPSPPRRDARLTVYPGVGHDSWTRTYDLSAGHDVYAWLLANPRP